MSRRRSSGGWPGDGDEEEGLGTPFVDVMTAAFGCVLLLFIIVALTMSRSLFEEKAAHEDARATNDQLDRRVDELGGRVLTLQNKLASATADLGAATTKNTTLADANAALEASNDKTTEELADARKAAESSKGEASALGTRLDELRTAMSDTAQSLDGRPLGTIDLVIALDGTSSMEASIDEARGRIQDIMSVLEWASTEPRIGVVVYRDECEAAAFRIQSRDLTSNVDELQTFLAAIEARNYECNEGKREWIDGALDAAGGFTWRDEAQRLVVLVTDAGNKPGGKSAARRARELAKSGTKVSVVSARDPHLSDLEHADVLMEHQAIARSGNGAHVPPGSGIMRSIFDAVSLPGAGGAAGRLRDALDADAQKALDALDDAALDGLGLDDPPASPDRVIIPDL